jgi:hypothetical protein
MSGLDALPPDQRAVLQLVLRQGRTYDDLAGILKFSPEAVRERARLGAETLTPAPRGLDEDDRGEVVDYLLGQDALGRGLLAESRPARVWARGLAEDLAPVAPHGFPDVPPEPASEGAEPATAPAAEFPAARDEAPAKESAPGEPRRSSRAGGAMLLAGIALFVLVLVIVFVVKPGHHDKSGASTPSADTTAAQSTTGASTSASGTTTPSSTQPAPTPLGTATLKAVDGSKAVGVAQLLSQGNTAGFVVAAKNVATVKGTYHGVWLSGSGVKPLFLGSVRNQDVRGGRISAVAPVPKGVKSYDTMLITAEPITTSKKSPSQPGQTILRGPLKITGNLG